MPEVLTIIGVVGVLVILYTMTKLRKVVATNEVHIVQKGSKSVAYGKGQEGGNVYYAWPAWVPMFGIEVQKLPLSIFALQLSNYEAYDLGKVPFNVDITAFFVIANPTLAAEKVSTISELKVQLNETLKGVVRKTLASKEIVEIMESRKEIKNEFKEQVFAEVKEWGVESKNVEFMDIRDATGSQVITNIMNKKRSLIEAESLTEVAKNNRDAEIAQENATAEARSAAATAKSNADIITSDANREAELKRIENEQLTENKDIEKEKVLAVRKEEAKQSIFESEKHTAEKQLAVKQLEEEKNAEIAKNIELIKADEQKQKMIIDAQADKESITLKAEADKIKVELDAGAEKMRIESVGLAKAKETDYIGSAEAKNKTEMAKAMNSYDSDALGYMVKELDVKLAQVVDLEKAKALAKADIKVISTGENGGNGVENFMQLFSAKGGANIGAMIESAKNTIGEEKVNEMISKIVPKNKPEPPRKKQNNIVKKENPTKK